MREIKSGGGGGGGENIKAVFARLEFSFRSCLMIYGLIRRVSASTAATSKARIPAFFHLRHGIFHRNILTQTWAKLSDDHLLYCLQDSEAQAIGQFRQEHLEFLTAMDSPHQSSYYQQW